VATLASLVGEEVASYFFFFDINIKSFFATSAGFIKMLLGITSISTPSNSSDTFTDMKDVP
jgi:hypothetical protein